jgi:hypothetical protein
MIWNDFAVAHGDRGDASAVLDSRLPCGFLWKEVQGLGVPGADDGEVSPVQGGHVRQFQPLGDGDD